MVMFFELMLHQIIKPEQNKDDDFDINNVKLPKNVDYEPEEEEEEKHLINFSSLNCTFVKTRGENLLSEIQKIKSKDVTNPIISVRSSLRNSSLSLVDTENIKTVFEDYNVVRFSCQYIRAAAEAFGLCLFTPDRSEEHTSELQSQR